MERKKLIRPVTILKVKKYMNDVFSRIHDGETLSLDKLAREHQISGSTATALIRNGWIEQTDVKFQYKIPKEGKVRFDNFDYPFVVDMDAKLLIEQVRLMNDSSRSKTTFASGGVLPANTNPDGPYLKNLSEDEPIIHLKQKSVKTPDLASLLKSMEQPNLFSEAEKKRQEVLQVASSIATGVYGSVNAGFSRMSEGAIQEINEKILFSASDLLSKVNNFKI